MKTIVSMINILHFTKMYFIANTKLDSMAKYMAKCDITRVIAQKS